MRSKNGDGDPKNTSTGLANTGSNGSVKADDVGFFNPELNSLKGSSNSITIVE